MKLRISKNFWLKELTGSSTGERLGIKNEPNTEQLVSLAVLTNQILQPVREQFGVVSVSSGLRVPELNSAIGGSKKSSHCKGEAADFEVYSSDNHAIALWIKNNLKFDQLILEFYTPGEPNSGWVHCSYKRDGTNRNQLLTAVKEGKSTKYVEGLNG
tara:strand:+ start:313 stop:783 length:471 start_codon:yes stop_codon:yes gene_type:complete